MPTPIVPTPQPTVENNSSVNFGQTSSETIGTFNVGNFQDTGVFIASNLEQGSRIISITGTTSSSITDVTIRVVSPNGSHVVAVDQVTPNPDGTFSTEFDVTNWKQDGRHMILAGQGNDFLLRDSIQVNVINGAVDTR